VLLISADLEELIGLSDRILVMSERPGTIVEQITVNLPDRDKPMQIEADSMRHDEAKLLTQFTGKVLATKGTLILRATRMDVQQDSQGRQVAKLWAAPSERVFFRQKREGLNEYTEGEAEEVTYDNQSDVVTLMRRADMRILRGTEVANQLQGHTIVFNNITEVITVDGGRMALNYTVKI
jgi:lipopolysaccharide export system protein LptA